MAIERQHVKEQDKEQRRHNFDPVESNLTPEQVKLEASRCLHCKNPRCVQGCPVNIHIPDFIQAIKEDNLDKAGEIIRQTSMLPSVCGRVCPQERQCEGNCILGIKGEAAAAVIPAQPEPTMATFLPDGLISGIAAFVLSPT